MDARACVLVWFVNGALYSIPAFFVRYFSPTHPFYGVCACVSLAWSFVFQSQSRVGLFTVSRLMYTRAAFAPPRLPDLK